MEVRCDKCQARYRVDDARIGPQGLTMRCGKCQNTFKVMREAPAPTVPDQAAVPPRPAPAKPAAKAPESAANATMVFGQAPVAPSKPAMPAAKPAAPAPAAAKPASKPGTGGMVTPAAATEEGAGRTMMFQTGNLKTPAAKKPEPESGSTIVFGQAPAAAKPAAPAAKPAPRGDPDAGSTMVFGQSPIKMPAAKPGPAAKKDEGAGATMMFGQAPAVAKAPAPAAKPAPAPAPEPVPEPAAEPEPAPEPQAAAAEPPPDDTTEPTPVGPPPSDMEGAVPETTTEAPPAESGVEAEGAEEESTQAEGTFDKAPPKGLLIGVAAGLAALLIAGGALVAVKKLGKHPPPPAAVETLTAAQTEADKDSLASLAAAETKAKDALDVAGPKSAFPEAIATLARIDIQWADALNDEANQVTTKGADGAETKAGELQTQAKAKLKAAFDALSPAVKVDPKSPDLQVALADYYRAQKSNSNMNKALKAATALNADAAKLSLIQGLALQNDEDGAEKAIPKLKAGGSTARVHYRLALAYQAMKDDANTTAELKETLKLSPQHERAKAALEAMTPPASADGK